MTGVSRDPGTSANFRYTTSTDMTASQEVLFPLRVDDYVFDGWAHLRRSDVIAKHIGDFRNWRTQANYERQVARLVRDLSLGDGDIDG